MFVGVVGIIKHYTFAIVFGSNQILTTSSKWPKNTMSKAPNLDLERFSLMFTSLHDLTPCVDVVDVVSRIWSKHRC
jgi:hypothetical protein